VFASAKPQGAEGGLAKIAMKDYIGKTYVRQP
jgi:hypothetical protein